MEKQIIKTNGAPAPIGPYNQATRFGNLVFISGQIAIDPNSGELKIDNLQEETELVMNNLKAVLAEAGMDFSNILKSTIFVTDMKDYAEVNRLYGQYFEGMEAPAREVVQVAALPRSVHVEISAIAGK